MYAYLYVGRRISGALQQFHALAKLLEGVAEAFVGVGRVGLGLGARR